MNILVLMSQTPSPLSLPGLYMTFRDMGIDIYVDRFCYQWRSKQVLGQMSITT